MDALCARRLGLIIRRHWQDVTFSIRSSPVCERVMHPDNALLLSL